VSSSGTAGRRNWEGWGLLGDALGEGSAESWGLQATHSVQAR
jgi:hypothetical protein